MMSTGKKLAVLAVVVVGVTGYMAYVGASASWQYYATVDECAADAGKFLGARIRVSGKIAPGSLHVADDRREARFSMAGSRTNLRVICNSSLPDNLAEGMEVVVEGRLEEPDLLRAQKLITRCASKYEARRSPAAPQDKMPVKPKDS